MGEIHPVFKDILGNVTKHTGTCATMPKHFWIHDVLTTAGISQEEADQHAAKLATWFNAGEPVWMAASSLKHLVKQGAVWEREERETSAARSAIRGALRGFCDHGFAKDFCEHDGCEYKYDESTAITETGAQQS